MSEPAPDVVPDARPGDLDPLLEAPRLRAVDAFPAEVEGRPVVCLRDPSGVTEAVLAFPRALGPILALFDGTRSVADVQAEVMRRHGELISRGAVESLVRTLDAHLFLEGPRLQAARARQRAAYLERPARAAFHAGRAYPDEAGALAASLEGYFTAPDGPGAPRGPAGARVRGLIAPHIDFARGGPAYGWAYRALAESEPPECVVVLGTAHAGLDGHAFAVTTKAYETPFGPLAIDTEVVEAFRRRAPGDLLAAEPAHRSEHSVEFQAVWLQYLRPRAWRGGEVRIVPVLASFVHECLAAGRDPATVPEIAGGLAALADALAASGRRWAVVAGADLAHVGPRFGDARVFGPAELARVEADDRALLAHAEAGDPAGFFQEALRQRDRNRVCGLSPIYGLLTLVSGVRGRVLRYGQAPDPAGTVSFASVSFGGAEAPAG